MAESQQAEAAKTPAPERVERARELAGEESAILLQRAVAPTFQGGRIDPHRLTPQAILALQRTVGNAAVNRLLQRKPLESPHQRRPTSLVQEPTDLRTPVDSPRPNTAKSLQSHSAATIQRAVGFEFETGNKLHKEDSAALGLKQRMWDDGNGLWHIQNDDRKLEFVTEPLTSLTSVKQALTGAGSVIKNILDAPQDQSGTRTMPAGAGWKRTSRLKITDQRFLAAPQSTEGVRLPDVPQFVNEHHEDAEIVRQQAHATLGARHDALELAAVRGLLYAIISFLRDVHNEVNPSDMGPKQALTLMHRTDFRSMYMSLSEEERNEFKKIVKGNEHPSGLFKASAFQQQVGIGWDMPIYGVPYHAPNANPERQDERWPGDTLKEFMTSLWKNPSQAADKDSQSPPAGYASHAEIDQINASNPNTPPEAKYSMGTHGMVEGRALFEVRNYGVQIDPNEGRFQALPQDDADIPYESWYPFAKTVFQGAKSRDDSLDTIDPDAPPVVIPPVPMPVAALPKGLLKRSQGDSDGRDTKAPKLGVPTL